MGLMLMFISSRMLMKCSLSTSTPCRAPTSSSSSPPESCPRSCPLADHPSNSRLTTTLPDGRSLTTTVSSQSDDLKKNRVNLKLDGTEGQLDSHFEWDVNNKEAMTMKMQAKGNNKRWGNYEISRDVKNYMFDFQKDFNGKKMGVT